jgi:hypothetical protein
VTKDVLEALLGEQGQVDAGSSDGSAQIPRDAIKENHHG